LYGNTYPSDAPRVRIDYIYTDDKARCFDFAIFKSQASDHLPICASITIPNSLG
jgi:endonuclease/exonuclease/phosphatase family metal-dependent hydrolase